MEELIPRHSNGADATVDGSEIPKKPPGMVKNPINKWDLDHINWCRILSINGIYLYIWVV